MSPNIYEQRVKEMLEFSQPYLCMAILSFSTQIMDSLVYHLKERKMNRPSMFESRALIILIYATLQREVLKFQ